MMGRVHFLPGTTQSNVIERRGTDPEKESRLTLAELQKWIVLEICGRYHQEIHSRIHLPPLAAWQDAFAKYRAAPPIVGDAQQFLLHFLPTEIRALQRDGLRLFHLRYWDNILPAIAHLKEDVLIRYDPRNLSRIFVLGRSKTYHTIPYADLRHPPISLWEHEAAIKALHAAGNARVDERAIFDTVTKQRELIETAAAKTKRARRTQQRRRETERPTPVYSPVDGESINDTTVEEYPVEIWEPRN